MEHTPGKLASEFVCEAASGRYLREHVARLAEWSASDDPPCSLEATGALFGGIIEPLADSFEPQAVSTTNRVLAQIIQQCRRMPRGVALDRELEKLGLMTEDELFSRAEGLTQTSTPGATDTSRMKRAIVLSRVTLGADVAITSVIIERLKQQLPGAEIVLVGGRKTEELFGGDPRLRFPVIGYQRGGSLLDRLTSWLDLLGCTRDLTEGLADDEYLIVDPDSRLTQLGLLPVGRSAAAANYFFFPSRNYGANTRHTLSNLAHLWSCELFGSFPEVLPRVTTRSRDRETATALFRLLRAGGKRPVVLVNFGIGDNPKKRVGAEFESSLVIELIQTGATVILDKGAGADEAERVGRVVDEIRRFEDDGRGMKVAEVDEPRLPALLGSQSIDARMLVWQGRIGLLAAMIGESDLYIGYDSAGQHIAAALGVPVIDVMAGFISPRMLDRWRPAGPAEVRVIPVDTIAGTPDAEAVLRAVMNHAREMLKKDGTKL
ncbi:MAG TPA: hypothetical protein VJH03_10500 [Blastocatellia bacterium]|nr:hypothetical protein [Blastocatellia bacterium]